MPDIREITCCLGGHSKREFKMLRRSNGLYQIECQICFARGFQASTINHAIDHWDDLMLNAGGPRWQNFNTEIDVSNIKDITDN